LISNALISRYRYFSYVNRVHGLKDKIRFLLVALLVCVPKRIRGSSHFYILLLNWLSKNIVFSSIGKQFRLNTFDDISHLREDYEGEIRYWFKIKKGDVFVDVGSNIGFYSLLLYDKASWVLAFEPCLLTFLTLEGNLLMNKVDNVLSYHLALSDHNGKGFLNITDHSGHNSLKSINDKVLRKEEIFLKRFDDLKLNLPRIDLVKIDVEGAELDVLNGMVDSIKKYSPNLIVEVKEPNVEGVQSFFDDNGYTVVDRFGENVYAKHL